MASRGARQTIRRITRAKEQSLGTLPGVPTYIQIRAPQGAGIVTTQDMYPDERWTTGNHETFAPYLGAKHNNTDLQIPFHHDIVADHGDVIETALGAKRAGLGALVLGAGSTVAQVTYTGAAAQVQAGDFLRIILAPSGIVHYRPVKSVTPGVPNIAILAIQMPTFTGGDAVSQIQNVSVEDGAQYSEAPGGVEDTYTLLGDQDGEPDSVDYVAKGCIPSSVLLNLATSGRALWSFAYLGAGWTQTSDGNIDDPDETTGGAVQWTVEVFVDDLDIPSANPSPETLYSFSAELAAAWEILEAFKSRTGTALGALPDTPQIAYRRMKPFGTPINTKYDYAQEDLITIHEQRTRKQMFIVAYGGEAGVDFNGDVVCLWFPRVATAGKPAEVWNKQIKGHDVNWQVEHNAAVGSKCFLGFFRGA